MGGGVGVRGNVCQCVCLSELSQTKDTECVGHTRTHAHTHTHTHTESRACTPTHAPYSRTHIHRSLVDGLLWHLKQADVRKPEEAKAALNDQGVQRVEVCAETKGKFQYGKVVSAFPSKRFVLFRGENQYEAATFGFASRVLFSFHFYFP